jgi:Cu(I)/Ag(I) efflux system membrane fusion protein
MKRPTQRTIARSIATALLGAALVATALPHLAGCGPRSERKAATATRYHCPMHPTYTSDKPGDCPICNMSLTPIPADTAAGSKQAAADHAGHGAPELSPPGRVPITISPAMEQRIGVRLARVERGAAERTIRAVGTIEYDETALHHVHTRVEGWIGRLYVASTGQVVRRGEALFSLYSPDLLASQEEYLNALAAGGDPTNPLAQAARRRLELREMTPRDIERLAAERRPRTHVDIVSHASGVVIEKTAIDGMRVMPGDDLYVIADLSRVWITAAIYEYELPLVHVGQEGTVTLSYFPGETFRGRVSYVYPYLDERTRTARVRLEFANPGGKLKPGMFANVELRGPGTDALTVPADAVLDSGEEQIVLVAAGGGRYEPRPVVLGPRLGDRVAVRSGIAAGEQVVVSAQFLIDSESQLKAALAGMSGGGEHRHDGE